MHDGRPANWRRMRVCRHGAVTRRACSVRLLSMDRAATLRLMPVCRACCELRPMRVRRPSRCLHLLFTLGHERVVRQMTAMMCHHCTQLLAPMEDVRAMIAMRVELPMPNAVRADHPDIRVAADEYDVPVGHRRHVGVIRHRLIGFIRHRLIGLRSPAGRDRAARRHAPSKHYRADKRSEQQF
jgi:hypothetical protein